MLSKGTFFMIHFFNICLCFLVLIAFIGLLDFQVKLKKTAAKHE